MPFHIGVFGNGTVYLTPPADVPNGTRAYVYILGQNEDPSSFYRRLVMIEPEDARLYNQLGMAQMDAGRMADAEASLSRAVSLDFGFAEAHYNMGLLYERQEQRDSALSAYQKAVDLAPDEMLALRRLVALLLRAEDDERVFEVLRAALAASTRIRTLAEHEEAFAPLHSDPRWAALYAE